MPTAFLWLLQDCSVAGTLHVGSVISAALHGANTITAAEHAATFPHEEPPFVFVPDRFTRKQ